MSTIRDLRHIERQVERLKTVETTGISEGTPASAAAAGIKGQIRWDANYLYICVATDTWIRFAKAAW